MESLHIIEKNLIDLKSQETEMYLDYQEKIHSNSKVDSVLRSREFRRKQMKVPLQENQTSYRVILTDGDQIIGDGLASYRTMENETNPENIWIYTYILPKYRGKGFGRNISEKLINFAKNEGKTRLQTGFYPENGVEMRKIMSKFGFLKKMDEKVSRLYKDKIKWDYINQSEEKLQQRINKEGYEILQLSHEQWATKILEDDDFAEVFSDFDNEVSNLIPREGIEMNDVVVTAEDTRRWARQYFQSKQYGGMNFYAYDGDIMIAMSGNYFPHDPPVKDVGTGLTAVRKDYQRRGIATYLKILVVKHYFENHPEFEYIFTENAGSNEGMLAINLALGFEPHHVWEFYQANIDEVAKHFFK